MTMMIADNDGVSLRNDPEHGFVAHIVMVFSIFVIELEW